MRQMPTCIILNLLIISHQLCVWCPTRSGCKEKNIQTMYVFLINYKSLLWEREVHYPQCSTPPSHKVHMCHLITFVVLTPIFVWYVIRQGSKNKHHKDRCFKEVRLRLQFVLTTPHSLWPKLRWPMYSI